MENSKFIENLTVIRGCKRGARWEHALSLISTEYHQNLRILRWVRAKNVARAKAWKFENRKTSKNVGNMAIFKASAWIRAVCVTFGEFSLPALTVSLQVLRAVTRLTVDRAPAGNTVYTCPRAKSFHLRAKGIYYFLTLKSRYLEICVFKWAHIPSESSYRYAASTGLSLMSGYEFGGKWCAS